MAQLARKEEKKVISFEQQASDAVALVIAAIDADQIDNDKAEQLGVALSRRAGRMRRAGGTRRTGRITRWSDTSGFATERGTGQSWFVSRDSLPDGHGSLPVGTTITFTGSPSPKPGKRYPEAYTIRVEAGHD
jgi:hypothetical protein